MSRVLLSVRWALLALLLAAASAAAQPVTLERDSPLYAEPRLDAAQVTQLKQGATGEVTARKGGWLNLNTTAGSGWLFSFNVRFPSQKAEGSGAGTGSALGRVFGPQRPTTVVSSIGIRGLGEEDLKQASFDAGQMKLLGSYAATKQAAEESARAKELAPVKVDYLDAKP
jgi:hypothetical protein